MDFCQVATALRADLVPRPNSFISARSRGGLVSPNFDGLFGILEEVENQILYKKHDGTGDIAETVRNIPIGMICVSTLGSPLVKSLWHNILLVVEESSPTQKLLSENIIQLFLRVQSSSYAKYYINKLCKHS